MPSATWNPAARARAHDRVVAIVEDWLLQVEVSPHRVTVLMTARKSWKKWISSRRSSISAQRSANGPGGIRIGIHLGPPSLRRVIYALAVKIVYYRKGKHRIVHIYNPFIRQLCLLTSADCQGSRSWVREHTRAHRSDSKKQCVNGAQDRVILSL